jgi:hypothetical protein
MPNIVLAPGEAMPISRRHTLGIIAGATVLPVAAVAVTDPLLSAIQQYKDGCAAYCGFSEEELVANEDAIIEATYGKPMDVLIAWDTPAVSLAGALAALKVIEDGGYIGGIEKKMLNAAITYLEGMSA